MSIVSFKRYECQKKAMSKMVLFSSQPSPAHPSPLHPQFLCYFRHHPSRKKKKNAPQFIHRSHIYKLNLWMSNSHIGQLRVIMRHHRLLKANIYCICRLVIGWLWCLSAALQTQDSLPLCVSSPCIFCRFTAPFFWGGGGFLPSYCRDLKPWEASQYGRIRGITELYSTILLSIQIASY